MPSPLFCNNCGAANQPQAAYCRSCGSSLQSVKPTLFNSATGQLLTDVMLKQRYRIIAPVGKGGMGAVYKAEDTQLGNRLVALKEMSQSGLSPQEQKEAADAFRQEAFMLARLQHPNLPNIFDHFEENGRWYLVMSFIEGETLEDYLDHIQGKKLPLEEVLQIGTQLCTVLGYLHNQQPAIIFRDLKPANIMRTSDGHIYLIDFGIARHFKPGQARDTAYYGSMGYAPQEQFGRAQTTPRSDIYSLGATLHQLLSGHDPSSSPFRFPSLQSLVPTTPTGLTTLSTQMLEFDEDKRPASMLLVKQELQALASPVGPKPKPPSPVPSPAQSVNVWAFGKQQLVTTLIFAVCYGIISYICISSQYNSTYYMAYAIPFGFLFLLPIFLGSFFGPWVGIGATGLGVVLANFIGLLIMLPFSDRHVNLWWYSPSLILSAFLAGLFLLKTKGEYSRFGNILFVWLLGLLDFCLAFLLTTIIAIFAFFGLLNFYVFFYYLLLAIPPVLTLLPILLFISNIIKLDWNRKSIQKHP